MTEPPELHLKYRPQSTKDVIGQRHVISTLNKHSKAGTFPHTILFSGLHGTGKTTLARIYAKMLKCGPRGLEEINCASRRGIELARDIEQRVTASPMGGDCRVWILDEIHMATGECQTALLKPLEEAPPWVYFFLCTTNPEKLKKTVVSRCHPAQLKPLTHKELYLLINRVATAEGIYVVEEAQEKIIDNAEGSARNALVLLNMIVGVEDEDEQLEIIAKADTGKVAIELARVLIREKPIAKWPEVARILKDLKDEDPEQLRYMVLGYANTVALGGGKPRAFLILEEFAQNFYDSKRAGLTLACHNVVYSGKN